MENIYADIAARTGGNIYIGVVGPVRTGKSTMIKRIMEQLVIPGIDDPYQKERAKDELPQSGSGRTIMTSEPKFVPENAVQISPDGTTQLRVRMIDSVGYMIDGAVGAEEDGVPRMVTTPWYDHEIPMTDAAELGTKKVMQEHCSIGIVVTTDGTVTDIPREDYVDAEARAIADMQATGKPFLVVVNSRQPNSEAAQAVQRTLQEQFGVSVTSADCQSLSTKEICMLLEQLLYTFPMQQLEIHMPRWIDALERTHPVKSSVYAALRECAEQIHALGQAENILTSLSEVESINDLSIDKVNAATGTVVCTLHFPETMFYQILSEQTGLAIDDDAQLMSLLTELSQAKHEYDKLTDAIASVRATGYGIVMPSPEETKLETPELLHRNGTYGVKLRAGAPSIHMIRVDIDTEISPMVGDEKQSRDLIAYLSGEEPETLWQSNIFGKSVHDMIHEGLTSKLLRTPADVREKFRGSLSRIVNEGATGLICLIL